MSKSKICKMCVLDLSIDNFERNSKTSAGYRKICKPCRVKKRKEYMKQYYLKKVRPRISGISNEQREIIAQIALEEEKKRKKRLMKMEIKEMMEKILEFKKEFDIPDVSIEEINKELETL